MISSFKYPVNYPEAEFLNEISYSQARQDLFVVAMTAGKANGTFLEFGAGHPINGSNTYILEKKLGWTGISVDYYDFSAEVLTPFESFVVKNFNDTNFDHYRTRLRHNEYVMRKITDIDDIPPHLRHWKTIRPGTQFIQGGAEIFDLNQLDGHYDYLQIDIDPTERNFELLKNLVPRTKFSVITFEHNVWDHTKVSQQVMNDSRTYLQAHGYTLVVNNVAVPPGLGKGHDNEPIVFEDWYAHLDYISTEVIEAYQWIDNTAKYPEQILFL
jgi:hypothetical protein